MYSANIFIMFITTVSNKLCSVLRMYYHYFAVMLQCNGLSWQHCSGCLFLDELHLKRMAKDKQEMLLGHSHPITHHFISSFLVPQVLVDPQVHF